MENLKGITVKVKYTQRPELCEGKKCRGRKQGGKESYFVTV